MSAWAHLLLKQYYSYHRRQFISQSADCESTQRKTLQRILGNLKTTTHWQDLHHKSYEQIIQNLELQSYENYRPLIEQQRSASIVQSDTQLTTQSTAPSNAIISSQAQRYEPTSGSTHARKWIPYTADFLSELNGAAAVWLGDIYQQFPSTTTGSHYWSLSWLPTELRQNANSDDSELFPWYQKIILKKVMAVNPKIALLPDSQMAWWATLLSLAGKKDLSLISVWSPTYLIRLIEDLRANWDEIKSCLKNSSWGERHQILSSQLGPAPSRLIDFSVTDNLQKVWPNLSLISCWDSSTSHQWSENLRHHFPNVPIQGKGLWATEGVVTFPLAQKKPLAINSHFFEFKNLKTGEVLPAWKLEKKSTYQPILWTSSGLLRYPLNDQVEVVDFYNSVPCLEFLGRIHSVDMVGEKIDADFVKNLFSKHPAWKPVSLVAQSAAQSIVQSQEKSQSQSQWKPHYTLFHQSAVLVGDADIENELLKLHHYKVARELGQLGPAKSEKIKDLNQFLTRFGKSPISGQNKIEILIQV